MLVVLIILAYFAIGLISARLYYRSRAKRDLLRDTCRLHGEQCHRRGPGCDALTHLDWTEMKTLGLAIGWPLMVVLYTVYFTVRTGVRFVVSNPPTKNMTTEERLKELEKQNAKLEKELKMTLPPPQIDP